MERLNKETLSFSALTITKVFATLGLTLFLAACGNSGGGGSTPPPPVVVPPPIVGVNGCTNCSAITQSVVLTTFESAFYDYNYSNSIPAVELVNVQMYGNAANVLTASTGNLYYQYQGPIAVMGTLEIAQTRYDANYGTQTPGCTLPKGNYQFQTTNVGQMYQNGYDISLPLITTTTGGIEFRIDAPSYAPHGMGFLNNGSRLNAYVSIVRINGVTCSSSFHYGIFN